MPVQEKKEEGKSKFFRRLKIYLTISLVAVVALLTALIVLLIIVLRDPNRSSYQARNISYTEIVKKNYVDGFKNAENSQEFSYILPNEDLNELLYQGTKQLDDSWIKNIYFDTDEQGYRNFYVDLKYVGVKTRVVIKTVPSVKDETTINLSLYSVTIGKLNAQKYLTDKEYLTSKFIDDYFEKCHLPITYNQESKSFEVKPYSWMNDFPTSNIGRAFFSRAKDIEGAYSFNSNLFGFNLDLSKLSKGYEYLDVDSSEVPDIYEEVKVGCYENFDSMEIGEIRTVYSLNEESINKMIKSSFVSEMKEEITSEYTSNKVVFDLYGCNVVIDQEDKITFRLFYSINGCLISDEAYINYVSQSTSITYLAFFEKPVISDDLVNDAFVNVLTCLTTTYDCLEFNGSNHVFSINLTSLNNEFGFDIKYSEKSIVINPGTKSIEFKITK